MKIYNGYNRLNENYSLLTDDYEFKMGYGYLVSGKTSSLLRCSSAALLNALKLAGKDIDKIKVVDTLSKYINKNVKVLFESYKE